MTPFAGGNRVTSPFGPRKSPISGAAETHRGQDIVPTDGNWQVRECTGGTVLRVTADQWRGKYVDVQTAPGVFQRYQHMDVISVGVGQTVPQGTVLGLAGSTGDVTGRHLHFGVYKNGTAEACAVNPAAFSGVPNTTATHPGNSALDKAPAQPEAPAQPQAPSQPQAPAQPNNPGGTASTPGQSTQPTVPDTCGSSLGSCSEHTEKPCGKSAALHSAADTAQTALAGANQLCAQLSALLATLQEAL